jgi:hypothetical protein
MPILVFSMDDLNKLPLIERNFTILTIGKENQ